VRYVGRSAPPGLSASHTPAFYLHNTLFLQKEKRKKKKQSKLIKKNARRKQETRNKKQETKPKTKN
jgi:hypothetical protein